MSFAQNAPRGGIILFTVCVLTPGGISDDQKLAHARRKVIAVSGAVRIIADHMDRVSFSKSMFFTSPDSPLNEPELIFTVLPTL